MNPNNKSFTILCLIAICITIAPKKAISQDQSVTQIHKYGMLKLKSGKILKIKKVQLSDEFLLFSMTQNKNISTQKTELSKIENLKVANKTNLLTGALIGTGVGVITMLLVEKSLEKPKQGSSNTIPWWSDGVSYSSSTGESTQIMAFAPKLFIVTGFTAIGILIGRSIKRGWKTIYPKVEAPLENIDINIGLNYNYDYTPNFRISYTF